MRSRGCVVGETEMKWIIFFSVAWLILFLMMFGDDDNDGI